MNRPPLDIMQQPDNIRIAQVVSQEDVSAAADPKPVTQPVLTEDTKEKAQKKLDLIYLVTPQEFNGEAVSAMPMKSSLTAIPSFYLAFMSTRPQPKVLKPKPICKNSLTEAPSNALPKPIPNKAMPRLCALPTAKTSITRWLTAVIPKT